MKNLKFELIIAYYKRPLIVRNVLESIKGIQYDNWHLTFIDDSGDDEFKDTFLNYGFDNNKITYVPILMSDNDKIKNGGSMFGKYVNDAIIKSDCDIVMLICDDDAVLPDYLDILNRFYLNNPDEKWAYCHVKPYNPNVENYVAAEARNIVFDKSLCDIDLNQYTTPINPFAKVDSSQVTFRKDAMVNGNVWYNYPQTNCLDADIFQKMYNRYGECKFIGGYGQYKGWFEDQLGVRLRSGKGDYID